MGSGANCLMPSMRRVRVCVFLLLCCCCSLILAGAVTTEPSDGKFVCAFRFVLSLFACMFLASFNFAMVSVFVIAFLNSRLIFLVAWFI